MLGTVKGFFMYYIAQWLLLPCFIDAGMETHAY